MANFTYKIQPREYNDRYLLNVDEFNYYISNDYYNNIYRFNCYDEDTNSLLCNFNISFSLKLQYNKNVTNIIRYQNDKNIIFIMFYNVGNWSETFMHFNNIYKLINYVNISPSNRIPLERPYFHEVFLSNKPTRMFFDLDIKDSDPINVDAYIICLVKKVSEFVNMELSYIITRNNVNTNKSRHIIFTNLVLENINQCKILASHFRDKYIDLQPYRPHASLRLFGSYKSTTDKSAFKKIKILDRCVGTTWDINRTYIQPNNIIATYKSPILLEQIQQNYEIYDDDVLAEKIKKYIPELAKYNFEIASNEPVYNCYKLNRLVVEECPICKRVHEKNDANYLAISKTSASIKCYRYNGIDLGPDRIVIESNEKPEKKPKYKSFKKIKPINYDDVFSLCGELVNKYESENARMPDKILSNCLYQISPCKSGKTQAIKSYIRELPEDKSIIFITTQRLFSIYLQEEFKELGFSLYCSDNWKPEQSNRMVLSLYSMHKLTTEDLRKFDHVIIDEVETLALNIQSVKELGRDEFKQENLHSFIDVIRNANQIIIMDAYPSKNVINMFSYLGKTVSINFNEYKTHKDDTIVFLNDTNELAAQLANSILRGKRCVFASGLKQKQKLILEKAFLIIKSEFEKNSDNPDYNFDLLDGQGNVLDIAYYSGDCDRKQMNERINDKNYFSANLLVYTSVITAGISYVDECFDQVFYLGFQNNGHIQALQSLYRVRNVKDKTYFICFDSSNLEYFDIKDLETKYKYLLDYDSINTDFVKFKELSQNSNNYIIKESLNYMNDSRKNYFKYIVGQFKYNGSKIVYYRNKKDDYKFEDPSRENFNNPLPELKKDIRRIKTNVKVAKLLTLTNEMIKPYLNQQELKPEHFTRISDEEFERLENIKNRDYITDQIFMINTYMRLFPEFNNNPSLEFYEGIKAKIATYKRYRSSYFHAYEHLTKPELWEEVRDLKNITSDSPEDRFRLIVATKFMCLLLGIDYNVNKNEIYRKIHDFDYMATAFTMKDVQKAFKKLFENEPDKNMFAVMFSKCFYKNGRDTCKKPIWERDFKSYYKVLDNILDGTYNLLTINVGRIRDKQFTFIRCLNLM